MPFFFVRAMVLALILCAAPAVVAQPSSPAPVPELKPKPPARVLLLGLWHFDNPGHDAVKFTPIDVMQPREQAYLSDLSARLAAFKPTKVLLEFPLSRAARFDQEFRDYQAGQFTLKVNEIYQIGFRVAKLAGLSTVLGFDEHVTPQDNRLWSYLPNEEPATMARLKVMIADLSARFEREHRTLGLPELLRKANSPEEDRLNKYFYVMLNDAGADKREFVGADGAAQWWQRNFRMYANIQMHAQPGDRVLVIAGSGHTAILRDLLAIDRDRVEESAARYF
ncbi:MAG: hypothetical protein JNJ55_01070 [Betaproteobacteria bacterium]|nr:hypothetical protein [Betaproteobacteria bacterium]